MSRLFHWCGWSRCANRQLFCLSVFVLFPLLTMFAAEAVLTWNLTLSHLRSRPAKSETSKETNNALEGIFTGHDEDGPRVDRIQGTAAPNEPDFPTSRKILSPADFVSLLRNSQELEETPRKPTKKWPFGKKPHEPVRGSYSERISNEVKSDGGMPANISIKSLKSKSYGSHGPFFPRGSSHFAYVREDADVGSHVMTVKAVVPSDRLLMYEIVRGNELGLFHIDIKTGHVSVANALDREALECFDFSIRAYDDAGHECFTSMVIRITDANDNAPVFDLDNLVFTAPCDTAHHLVGILRATDMDIGRNGQIHYGIEQDAAVTGLFSVDPVSGALHTLEGLLPGHYRITVTAQDYGYKPMRSSTLVTVRVECFEGAVPTTGPPIHFTDRAIQLPRCPLENPYLQTVFWDSRPGTVVASVGAGYMDGSPITYSLFPEETVVPFTIDQFSGIIRLTKLLDNFTAEYPLTWIAHNKMEGKTVVAPMDRAHYPRRQLIPPTAVIGPPPMIRFNQDHFGFVVRCGEENLAFGRMGVQVFNSEFPPFFRLQSTLGLFRVHPETGELFVTSPLPPLPPTYHLVAMASSGPATAETTITVNVVCPLSPKSAQPVLPALPPKCPTLPVDVMPVLTTAPPGTLIATVFAMAPDNHPLRYSLVPSMSDRATPPYTTSPSELFSVNPYTGGIMLTGSLHQFQANSSVDLTILATDLATGILCKALVRVPIVTAKRPPNFPFPTYLFETGCLVHNQLIGRIQAYSPENERLIYNLFGSDAIHFSVNKAGELRSATPSHRGLHTYLLILEARDGTGMSSQVPVMVRKVCRLHSEEPLDIAACPTTPLNFAVMAFSPTKQVLGSLAKYFPGRALKYHLLSGSDVFGVELETGAIFLRQRTAEERMQIPEGQTSFIVRVLDSTIHNFCDVHVIVTFLVPHVMAQPMAFRYRAYHFAPGCNPPGSFMGAVELNRLDMSPNLRYELMGPDASLFSIDSSTGEIRTKSPLTAPNGKHVFSVEATDTGGRVARVPVYVSSRCDFPRCPSLVNLELFDDAAAGTLIGKVPLAYAYDREARMLRYEISSPPQISVAVDPQSGEITLTKPLPQPTVFTPFPWFGFTITGTDQYGLSCNIAVQVNVRRSPRPPEFLGLPYIFIQPCYQETGFLGRVRAVCPDSNLIEGSEMMYSLDGPNARLFNIDRISGELRFVGSPSKLTGRYYPLQVVARASNGLSSTTTVRVELPYCPMQCPNVVMENVSETVTPGTVLLRLKDRINPPDANYFFRIVGALPSDAFQALALDPVSGSLTINGSLNGRGGQFIELQIRITVRAADLFSIPDSCSTLLRIAVVPGTPMVPPTCPPATVVATRQDAQVGTILIRVTSFERGEHTYMLLDANEAQGFFEMDPIGGAITVAKPLHGLPVRTYPLAVRVSLNKDTSQFCTTTVMVTLQSGDHTLQCPSSETPITVNLEATASPGDPIAVIKAFSPAGLPVTFTNLAVNFHWISVNQTSGVLALSSEIFGVIPQTYQFTVRATDYNGAFCDSHVIVQVPAVNKPPFFVSSDYHFTVDCGPSNSFIGTVTARDPENDFLSLSVMPSNVFTIDQIGTIRTRTAVTAATDAQTLTVSAEDNYGRSAVMFAHVSFEGPTCFTVPNCPQPGYRFWIPGDALPGFPVGTVYADGFQTNGQRMPVHYSVFGPDHGLFGIDSATGTIQLLHALVGNGQTAFQIGVRATLIGPSVASLFCDMTVQIQTPAPRDNALRFAHDSYTFTVPCGHTVHCMGALLAIPSYASTRPNLVYTITENSVVRVDQHTGEICLREGVVGSPKGQSSIVSVIDKMRGGSATATVTVNFQPCYHPPICPRDLSTAINEADLPNTRVQQVQGIDQNGGDILSYSIVAGNANDAFEISQHSGDIRIKKPLDRERIEAYRLVILVQDISNLSCESIVDVSVIDNNDNTPVFVNEPYNWSAPCGRPFAYVGTLSAVDADIGINGRLTYFIAPNSPIAVDGQTGEVRTQVPLDAGPSSLITGGVATHTFVVFASDAGSPQRTASTTIRILIDCPRNSAPLCPPTQMLHIPENPPLDSYVSKVKVTNSDTIAQTFHYSLTGPESTKFRITNEGDILVAGSIDRESLPPAFTLMANVVSSGGEGCRTAFSIIVTDENDQTPVFQQDEYHLSVKCGHVGPVHTITATDADMGRNSVVSHTLNGSNIFSIDAATGVLRSTIPVPQHPHKHVLTLAALDGGFPQQRTTATVIINVNCVVTTVPSATYPQPVPKSLTILPFVCPNNIVAEVQENQSRMVISNVQPSGGRHGLIYSLLPSEDAKSFALDGGNSGRLVVNLPLDREAQSTYFLTMRISNSGGQNCDVAIRVNVVDLNDNPPVFLQNSYKFLVDCRSGHPPFQVGAVSANDADIGVNGGISYAIENSPDFSIDVQKGVIKLSHFLPSGTQEQVDFVASAANPSFPVKSTTAVVSVRTGRNCVEKAVPARSRNYVRASPKCIGLRGSPYNHIKIAENTAVGVSLGVFEAVRVNPTQGLVYRIASGDPFRSFFLNPETGNLRVNGVLDREVRAYHNLTIVVTDNSELFCSLPVLVELLDVNDNPPEILNMLPLVATVNCSLQDAYIVQILAVDRDKDLNAGLLYGITAEREFTISSTGEIRTAMALDRDPPARFFTVKISDTGLPSLTTTVSLTINVMCPSAQPATFDQQYYCAGIREGLPVHSEVTKVKASYAKDRADIDYVIRSGNTDLFSIDPRDGTIRTRTVLNAENPLLTFDNTLVIGTLRKNKTAPDAYTIVYINLLEERNKTEVFAETSKALQASVAMYTTPSFPQRITGEHPFSTEKTFDENDEDPVFLQKYETSVSASTPVNSALLRVQAQDHDKTYPNNIIDYRLTELNSKSEYFRMDSFGELVIAKPLDPLIGQTVPVVITALDGGNPQRSSTTTAQITVTD